MNPHRAQPVLGAGEPLESCRAAAILVHGRGRGPQEMLDLAARLELPGVAYLAPTADGASWYPQSFLAPREQNEPQLSHALAAYDELVQGVLGRGLPRRRLVLLGFSQGACLTAEYAARHPGRYGGVVLFTGGLIGPPGTSWALDGAFDGAPVLVGGGDADPFVPEWRMRESAAIFRAMGAAVQELIYAGGEHLVGDAELAAARAMLTDALD
jgi:predicted esterase